RVASTRRGKDPRLLSGHRRGDCRRVSPSARARQDIWGLADQAARSPDGPEAAVQEGAGADEGSAETPEGSLVLVLVMARHQCALPILGQLMQTHGLSGGQSAGASYSAVNSRIVLIPA